jgi:hypothetical protein
LEFGEPGGTGVTVLAGDGDDREAPASDGRTTARVLRQSCGLGPRVRPGGWALVARIVDNPFLFQRVHGETRRAVLSQFPYAIYFRAKADEVVVLAIHERQDASRWQERS